MAEGKGVIMKKLIVILSLLLAGTAWGGGECGDPFIYEYLQRIADPDTTVIGPLCFEVNLKSCHWELKRLEKPSHIEWNNWMKAVNFYLSRGCEIYKILPNEVIWIRCKICE